MYLLSMQVSERKISAGLGSGLGYKPSTFAVHVLTETQPLQITLRHWQTDSRVWITFLTKCFSLLLLGNKSNYNTIGMQLETHD